MILRTSSTNGSLSLLVRKVLFQCLPKCKPRMAMYMLVTKSKRVVFSPPLLSEIPRSRQLMYDSLELTRFGFYKLNKVFLHNPAHLHICIVPPGHRAYFILDSHGHHVQVYQCICVYATRCSIISIIHQLYGP